MYTSTQDSCSLSGEAHGYPCTPCTDLMSVYTVVTLPTPVGMPPGQADMAQSPCFDDHRIRHPWFFVHSCLGAHPWQLAT